MAEIYASQGHYDQALAVYRKIVERQPHDPQYRGRIEELLGLAKAAAAKASPASQASQASQGRAEDSFASDERTVRALEDWLDSIRKSRGA